MSNFRREKPSFGVLWCELELDGEREHSTGRFVAEIEPTALARESRIACFADGGLVRMAFAVHPVEREVIVLLANQVHRGREMRAVFTLPAHLDLNVPQQFETTFSNWQLAGATLNSKPLEKAG